MSLGLNYPKALCIFHPLTSSKLLCLLTPDSFSLRTTFFMPLFQILHSLQSFFQKVSSSIFGEELWKGYGWSSIILLKRFCLLFPSLLSCHHFPAFFDFGKRYVYSAWCDHFSVKVEYVSLLCLVSERLIFILLIPHYIGMTEEFRCRL